MTNSEQIGQKSSHFITSTSVPTKINLLIYILGVIINVGRYFPIISLSSASINILLAVNDFLSNNIGFAVLNSLFAISGFIFLLQMRKVNSHRHHFNRNKIDTMPITGKS